MFQTIRNAWKVPELRKKLLYTVFALLIFRLGASIPVPYIDKSALANVFDTYANTMLGYINMISGGSFSQATIFALSIQPYINASIIIQLLAVAIPALERLAKDDGEEGRRKLTAITRYSTIALGILMGFAYYTLLKSNSAIDAGSIPQWFAAIIIIATFTAGSTFIMWLGERISEKGIGNGISMILFAGIVSRLPQVFVETVAALQLGTIQWYIVAGVVVLAIAVIGFVVFFTNAERRVPVNYAKRVVGRKLYGGRSSHIPLKVNMSGVMPIIFASSFVTLPATIAAFFKEPAEGSFWDVVINKIFSPESWPYAIMYLVLILAFSYFYAAISVNPVEISNNIRKNGGFVPGFRPGKPTSDFIAKIINKLTLFGAVFLGLIAVLPIILGAIVSVSGLALGGTSLLIVVGVALETVKALEAQLMMRNYKGFLE